MATKDKNYLLAIHEGLDKSLDRQVDALPKNFNKPRFMQNCLTVLQDGTADFSKIDPKSVVRTLMKGAFLGLDFFNGECYAIPFGDKLQFLTDYRGEIKLAKLYSTNPIKDIYAKCVRENDEFVETIENGQQSVSFKPKAFNDGEIIGAFAVCLYQDGSMIYDTMSRKQIEHTRDVFSKAKESKAWKESFGEMAKKTVLRRLCKLIDLNFESAEAKKAFDEGAAVDFKDNKPEYKAQNPYEEEKTEETVIDVPAEEVKEVEVTDGEKD
jgi:recombination protein RecT